MEGKRRRSWERTALILIAAASVVIMLLAFRMEKRLINERAMYYQLQSIRKSIDLFRTVEGRNPESLKELASESFSFSKEELQRPYLITPAPDARGLFPDVFGNYFDYDPKTGRVISRTPGYEGW
ncbi:MAG TPA: hypothetical protein PLZ86_02620 [bacterium]|nr:hypothetical protein [bacterium]